MHCQSERGTMANQGALYLLPFNRSDNPEEPESMGGEYLVVEKNRRTYEQLTSIMVFIVHVWGQSGTRQVGHPASHNFVRYNCWTWQEFSNWFPGASKTRLTSKKQIWSLLGSIILSHTRSIPIAIVQFRILATGCVAVLSSEFALGSWQPTCNSITID